VDGQIICFQVMSSTCNYTSSKIEIPCDKKSCKKHQIVFTRRRGFGQETINFNVHMLLEEYVFLLLIQYSKGNWALYDC